MKCWKCGYAIAHGEDDGLAYATNPPQYAHAQCRERGKDLRIAELEASLSGSMREKAGMVEALFNDDARVAELEAEVARLRAESAGHREPMVGDRVIVAHWSDFDPDDAVEIGTLSGVDGGYFYIFGSRRAWRYCKFVAALAGEVPE